MKFFFRSRFHTLNRWISKLPGFSKQKNSIAFLNVAQFLGVLNDNIFKLVMVFLLIESLGHDKASNILSAAGAIYVIPFLLFSSAAGILADRFSKQRLLVAMKGAEIIIMTLALFIFGWRSEWGSYTLLFFLSMHSALFGPSKYGIIPELVSKENVPRANGLITSFTYLAMILGTFLASFLTDITNYNFVLIAGFCLLVALSGFISAFGIRRTPSQGSNKRLNPFFISEIYQTLKFCRQKKHLLPAIFSAAFFLFLGAFTQLNIIPFAMQSLKLSEVAGGYLFLSTALGIAFGAYLGGRISRKKVELGLSCVTGAFMSVLLFLLALFPHNLYFVIFCLILLGICGGIFIVPFESFIQIASPDEKRGQVIAAGNFLSFSGVLIASFALFFFSQVLEITSAIGFALVGVITLIVAGILFFRLADYTLPYLTKKLLLPFCRVKINNFEVVEKSSNALLMVPDASFSEACLLLPIVPGIRLFVIEQTPSLWNLFYNISSIKPDTTQEEIYSLLKEGERGCVLIKEGLTLETSKKTSFFKGLLVSSHCLYVYISKKKNETTITFSSKT
jgi:acyl-[acyl-carrier-protein]-phospholipid O-acyltransferase/long-chain-fatty-acid--[acyl-carrier-protein] ligase